MIETIVSLAGLNIQFELHNGRSRLYFKDYIRQSGKPTPNADLFVPPVDQFHIEEEATRINGDKSLAEFSLLIEPLSNRLLGHNRFIFHGAAFIWHKKAFIITGPSGVGKSTQLSNWMNLHPDEIEIINGDKPIIERRNNEFIVHPSPWKGKENWGGDRSAPLGGIVLLNKATVNSINRLSPKQAAYPIFLQFLYLPTDVQSLDHICSYEEDMLKNVPVWLLNNTGTPESAMLTHRVLSEVF